MCIICAAYAANQNPQTSGFTPIPPIEESVDSARGGCKECSERVIEYCVGFVEAQLAGKVGPQPARDIAANQGLSRICKYILLWNEASNGTPIVGYDSAFPLNPYLVGLAELSRLDWLRSQELLDEVATAPDQLREDATDGEERQSPTETFVAAGAGKAARMSDEQIRAAFETYARGRDARSVAEDLGLTVGQVNEANRRFKEQGLLQIRELLEDAAFAQADVDLIVNFRWEFSNALKIDARRARKDEDRAAKNNGQRKRRPSNRTPQVRQRIKRLAKKYGCKAVDLCWRFDEILGLPLWKLPTDALAAARVELLDDLRDDEAWIRFDLDRKGVSPTDVELYIRLWRDVLPRVTANWLRHRWPVSTARQRFAHIAEVAERASQIQSAYRRNLPDRVRRWVDRTLAQGAAI